MFFKGRVSSRRFSPGASAARDSAGTPARRRIGWHLGVLVVACLSALPFLPAARAQDQSCNLNQSCEARARQACAGSTAAPALACPAAACKLRDDLDCGALAPKAAGEANRTAILECLTNEKCKCAHLMAGTFKLDKPLVVTKKQDNNLTGLTLFGEGAAQTTLRTPGDTCNAINWTRTNAPNAPSTIASLTVDLSACSKNDGAFAVLLNNTAGTKQQGVATATVRNVAIRGALGGSQGGGSAGGNEIADLGYRIPSGTSNGTGGIRVNNSRAQIECNVLTNVAFALELSNGAQVGDGSGSAIVNNRIVGAANVPGCTDAASCSQGRGIKLQACDDVPHAPLRDLAVSGNCASGYGGKTGGDRRFGDGSGLDLICGVQYSSFTCNEFDGNGSGAQYGLQVRGSTPLQNGSQFTQSVTSPSHHNRFANNRFSAGRNGGSLCRDCYDVHFIEDASEQDGAGSGGLSNGNLANGGGCSSTNCLFAGNRPCGVPPQAGFQLPAGASGVALGQSITLTAAGVRPSSAVTYSFHSLSGGADPSPVKVNAGGDCRLSSPLIVDAAKGFRAGVTY